MLLVGGGYLYSNILGQEGDENNLYTEFGKKKNPFSFTL